MRNINYFLIFIFVFNLVGCLHIPIINIDRNKNHKENVFLSEDNQLYYFGALSEESNKQTFQLYNSAKIKPKRLIIFSNGGDVYIGMSLGEFVFNNQLDVEVNRLCFSSCANYVFTAAKNKYLNPDSILGWHGSSWQHDINKEVQKGEEWAVKWRKKEIAFFKNINVNMQITINGFSQYKWRNYIKAYVRGLPISGFNYSVDDMKKFGVGNIYFTQDKWNWKKANKEMNVLRVKAFP